MTDYEKLGSFYLGRIQDFAAGETTEEPLLYDSKDLCTHAVCVGMTGSGKTGLGVALIEEAAIDGIPALVIDPKGDMANLALAFPQLRPADFEPWIDGGEATRKGRTVAEHAAATAELWRNGLAGWDQDGDRIRMLGEAAELAVYTPGSTAGRPIAVLGSFAAPTADELARPEEIAERARDAAASLLALLGGGADPLRSRESTLIQNVLHHEWNAGRGVALANLIRLVQRPPFAQLGVLDLESYYPEKDRADLAMDLNGLLASPSFARWLVGEPLDVGKLLYTDAGKPRVAVLSIAHLSEAERMFFVTRLLGEVVSWMRRQGGTSSLRALLYMDEIFGFFPPTAAPPSKRPMLTLLKQARAYGLGVVLATQNPVDLDYKGLANTGTWFVGRLQTARDKERLLDGLEGATGGGLDRGAVDAMLSGLGKRVFLLHNVHGSGPVTFHTRWVLSYLRGPMTLEEIRRLAPAAEAAPEASSGAAAPAARVAAAPVPPPAPAEPEPRPVLPKGVEEYFLPRRGGLADGERLVYRPALLTAARLHYVDRGSDLDAWEDLSVLGPLVDEEPPVEWEEAEFVPGDIDRDLRREPEADAAFGALHADAAKSRSYTSWARRLKDHLYRGRTRTVWRHDATDLDSRDGEGEGEFRARVRQALREERDVRVEKLKDRYAKKIDRLDERIRKAKQKVDVQEDQWEAAKESVSTRRREFWLGSLLRGKLFSRSTLTKAGMTDRAKQRASKEKADIERAKKDVAALREQRGEVAEELAEALEEARAEWSDDGLELERDEVRPRKSDVSVDELKLVWCPWRVDANGIAEPAWAPQR